MTIVNNKNKDTVVSLVLDSAPLIKRVNLFNMAQKFYTIPEVIAEIRDKQAREQLENSLVDIQVKVPSEEALNAGFYLTNNKNNNNKKNIEMKKKKKKSNIVLFGLRIKK